MYTILVNNDNSLYGSHKERIIKGSKLVDNLVFIVDPIYKGIDMTNASVLMEYLLPVSRKYKTELLTLTDEKYNDCFLQYKLPFDTNLTSEAGSVELKLTFAYVELDANGNNAQRVRKTSSTTIEITPVSIWSDIIPDEALNGLDQRLIVMNAQIQAIDECIELINENKADNLVYDDSSETLQLMAGNKGIGNKVSVRDMLDDGVPVVDLNSDSDNNSNTKPESGCNCGDCECEDNVVEFGDFEDNTVGKPDGDDDNVVEF